MRMPELKSLARDRRLRIYSRMRKAELVAFFDDLGLNYSPLCRAKGPTVPASALTSNVSLNPLTCNL